MTGKKGSQVATPAGRKARSSPGTCPGLCEVAGRRGQASVMGIFDPFCYPYPPPSQFHLPPMPQISTPPAPCSKQAQQVSFPQERPS